MHVVIVRNPFVWYRWRSWLSLFIRARYNSWSNHVGFWYYDEEMCESYILESDTPNGVQWVPFNEWRHKDKVLKKYDVLFDIVKAKSYVGRVRYDYGSIFKHLLNWYYWTQGQKDKERQTCYEYMANVLSLEKGYKFRPIDAENYLKKYEVQVE